jgi:hypothetical protein
MNSFKSLLLLAVFATSGVFAQAVRSQDDKPTNKLVPFTARTNYMSVSGFLRFQSYLETRRRLRFSIDESANVFLSDTQITVDLGNQGQIGDVAAMDIAATSYIAQFIKAFPKLKEYRVLWSYWFSVGEGKYSYLSSYGVTYDKKSRIFSNTDHVIAASEKDVIELDRKNEEMLRKAYPRK